MSPRTSRQSIDTAVGRVDATALEELRENFGTDELLDLVDPLDEWRARIGDPNGLRADLLRLHALAHTLVNGAPLSVSTGDEAIWELADALESELMEIEEGAKRAMQLLRPLLKLAPDDPMNRVGRTTISQLRITDVTVNSAPDSGGGEGGLTALLTGQQSFKITIGQGTKPLAR
jgi:hypothetical protein